MKIVTVTFVLAAIFTVSTQGQGFLNLNFESAYDLTNPPDNGELVSMANALPDWTAYANNSVLSQVYYVSNNFPGSSTLVELEGGSLALSGDFSSAMFDGGSISQTGMVPANAESLQFEATFGAPSLQVTLGGQRLSYSLLSQGSGYSVYGVNIPAAMAGQTETLTFDIEGPAQSLLDNIQFSTMGVPEPSEWALIGVRCRRKRARVMN